MIKLFYESDMKELEGIKFNSQAEVEAEEAKISEKAAAKKKAAEERKEDADAVKKVFETAFSIEKQVSQGRIDAYKNYLNELDKMNKQLAEAKEAKIKALKEFCQKHPEGFHDTIKFDDIEYRIDYASDESSNAISLSNLFSKIFLDF